MEGDGLNRVPEPELMLERSALAHPRALSFFLFYLVVLIGPLLLVALFAPRDLLHRLWLAIGVFAISALCLSRWSALQSRRHGD